MLTDRHGATTAPDNSSRWKLNETDTAITPCPACGCHVAVLFYDGGRQPLATLGWPQTPEEARSLERLPLHFVRCVDCGHVFNSALDCRKVPYSTQPNRMFNGGAHWSRFLQHARSQLLPRLPEAPTVVEIGHGQGAFLEALAEARPGGRYVGFDPQGATQSTIQGVEFHRARFNAQQHLASIRPDLLVSRHVLEHLANPLAFVQSLSFAASVAGVHPLLYLEVPCIDRALETGRIQDFCYEHNSQFTTGSFSRMLARSFTSIDSLDHGYDGEVLYAFLRLKGRMEHVEQARRAKAFAEMAAASRHIVMLELANLYMAGKRVAVWGGTGKGAAFLNAHRMDAQRFPLVVDSDEAKAGTFVPGTGQKIQFRGVLEGQPPDVILIPCQWRARDIVEEMARVGIVCERVLIPHGGRLVDFHSGVHPYHGTAAKPDATAELLLAAG